MWDTIVGFFRRTLEKMGLVSHSYTSVPTPSGDVDLHYPDGNDGTVAIPLTWATIPSFLQVQEGSTVSVDLAALYLTQAGSPNATITAVSGTLPTGWALSTAGLLTYNGTGIGSVALRARATRLTKKSDSNFFTVQSIAHVASADTQAPTIPTGIRLVSQTSTSATVACDAPADVPTSLIPSDGMKEVRWFKGGVLDGSVSALTPGLLLRMSGVNLAAAATGREMTVGTWVAITPAQRTAANGIPNAGTVSDAGPCCTNVKAFLLRKTWGTELELTPGVFTVSGIKKELADCASYASKRKLWVMIVNRTFENPVDMTFASSVGGALSGTLSVAVPNGQYGVEFSNGQQRTPVTVTNGTHAAWSGALSAGSILTAQAMKYSNNPMPSDLKTLADPFTGNVGLGGGWQARRWNATVRDRFDKLCKGLYAALKDDPNYDCLAGICTQETANGSPAASTGYTFLSFADALMGEMDSIANAFPTKRQIFFFNAISGTTNAQFNELMGMSTTSGSVAGVPAGREGVLQHALSLGVVAGFPDLVMKSGTLTSRNYLLVKAYHDAGGFTMGSIQGAEFTGINPGDTPTSRPMANVFAYGVGNTSFPDDNGANPLKLDSICPDFHPAGGPAGDLSFVNDCVPLIKSATYNPPYGTITAPTGMADGTVTQTGVDYSVLSFGSGIGATADEWTAARVGVNGDFTFIAKLNAITGTDTTGAVAGISVRDGTGNVDARAVHLVVTTSKIRSRARLTPGAGMTNVVDVAGQSWSTAKWLKITRVGNLFSYFWSTDGKAWTAIGTVTVTMSTSVYAELFSAPVSVATSVTASFKQVNIQNLAGPTHTFSTLTPGTYNFTAVARDLALNDSAASPTLAVTIS